MAKDRAEYFREYAKKYRITHKDKIKENNAKSRIKYKEYYKKKFKEWSLKNKDKRKIYMKTYGHEWNKKNGINNHLNRRYGITLEQKENMRIAQNNKCAICGDLMEGDRNCCIDHDHKTKKTRQLLCYKCNVSLGLLRENISILQNAINYLIKWSYDGGKTKNNNRD